MLIVILKCESVYHEVKSVFFFNVRAETNIGMFGVPYFCIYWGFFFELSLYWWALKKVFLRCLSSRQSFFLTRWCFLFNITFLVYLTCRFVGGFESLIFDDKLSESAPLNVMLINRIFIDPYFRLLREAGEREREGKRVCVCVCVCVRESYIETKSISSFLGGN